MAEQDKGPSPPEILPAERKGKPPARSATSVAMSISTEYSGCLPPPSYFEHYERVCPGAADRILGMAERQAEHRQEIEKRVVEGNIQGANWNRFFATLIVLATIGLTAYLVRYNQSAYGISLIIAELAALAGIFLYGSRSKRDERIKKEEIRSSRRRPKEQKAIPEDTPDEDFEEET